ncbi:3'-5' exonuclease Snipper [Cylas formicarius]|uniref:3'-5' exonuclease Snipper n=1 Tax=Cylas formicarius TaxID=197179 RepID=UPI0029585317|nr:3'-5' exonuclease Snipper [Cylas formicarius]
MDKPEITTLALARSLNCIETIFAENKALRREKQFFDYLMVLDFEATCWNKTDYDKGQSEIIEFPCVLYDVVNDKVISEFQQYVMPTERQKLSTFCTELTGIQQTQVDNGVPLKTCLVLFHRWLNQQILKYNISLKFPTSFCKTCVFATWSDWDLGNCLKNECRRKGIIRHDMFNRWIDVRSLYVEHYNVKPKGLLGALNEVGLTFEGTQHCGLHDARNTAKLIGKMVNDGVGLRITKDISNK